MKNWILALVAFFVLAGSALAAVNINTATKEELTSLKGVGDKRAQESIDYRNKNGGLKTGHELEKVPGIGPGIMKQIRSQVTVTGKTTVSKPTDKAPTTKAADTTAKSKADAPKSTTAKTDEKKVEKK